MGRKKILWHSHHKWSLCQALSVSATTVWWWSNPKLWKSLKESLHQLLSYHQHNFSRVKMRTEVKTRVLLLHDIMKIFPFSWCIHTHVYHAVGLKFFLLFWLVLVILRRFWSLCGDWISTFVFQTWNNNMIFLPLHYKNSK